VKKKSHTLTEGRSRRVVKHALPAIFGNALEEEVCEPEHPVFISSVYHGRMAATSSRFGEHLNAAEPQTINQIPEQTSEKRDRQQLSDKQNKFECVDCEDKVTFSRKSDSDRHKRLKHSHGDHQHYVCNAKGCFRGQARWSFARSDKLTSHTKATHNLNTIFDQCPIQDCSFGSCTLEVLGVHIQRAHQYQGYEAGRAVLNVTSCKALRCPLWRCGKHVSAKKLLQHITSHAKEEIEAANPSLQLIGLLVQSAPGYDVAIQVVCPVCHTLSTDVEHFTRHVSTAHLYKPGSGGSEHFEKWKAYLRQHWLAVLVSSVNELLPWSSLDRVNTKTGSALGCPSCTFSVTDYFPRHYWDSDQMNKETEVKQHHLSLLRPEAEVVRELYPYRMQILRLWPEFVTHPVFADFDQPQQQSRGGPSRVQPSLSGHRNNDFETTDWTAHTSNQPQHCQSEAQTSLVSHFDDDFEIPDWTTYDFNISM
jgi:uncharacterized C2H2 Zn-finger protein